MNLWHDNSGALRNKKLFNCLQQKIGRLEYAIEPQIAVQKLYIKCKRNRGELARDAHLSSVTTSGQFCN